MKTIWIWLVVLLLAANFVVWIAAHPDSSVAAVAVQMTVARLARRWMKRSK